MIAQDLKAALQGVCSDLVERESLDWPAFNCPADSLLDLLKSLRDDHNYNMLVDATAIDNGVETSPRFTVVYHVHSTTKHDYVRLAADCADDENPTVASASELWPAANWMERETYDLMGIKYDGHPDLRRILMWDGYGHHPLRKDFPLAGFETELHDDEIAEITGTKVKPAPMAGGPFVAPQSNFPSEREPGAKDESWNEENEKPDA